MIKFYYNLAPNPTKVALFLEEAGLPYEPIPIDTRKGDQHTPAFRAINPNGKVPAIVDGDATVFDSNAILLYLAEKTGKFLPENTPAARGQLYSWLMFVGTGVGPFSGQAVHFSHHAPEKLPYAVNRYRFEAKRHYGILDAQLAKHLASIEVFGSGDRPGCLRAMEPDGDGAVTLMDKASMDSASTRTAPAAAAASPTREQLERLCRGSARHAEPTNK